MNAIPTANRNRLQHVYVGKGRGGRGALARTQPAINLRAWPPQPPPWRRDTYKLLLKVSIEIFPFEKGSVCGKVKSFLFERSDLERLYTEDLTWISAKKPSRKSINAHNP